MENKILHKIKQPESRCIHQLKISNILKMGEGFLETCCIVEVLNINL
jgi:hypothetical protein